jgi:hypothetical protein
MKRFLPLLAMLALLLPAFQPARGADVSINFFYDNLGGGNWYEVSDYGYVWQPDIALNASWRPYTDGYWAYTDQGWTWVSYEDFGWATYHYGRWARLSDYGWVWVPGYEWGPAWVSWRTGGDYVGWAPLPPGGREIVYESRPIGPRVDIEFGIGPAYYNFIDLRYIGEPVLRDRIYDYNQNVVYINKTVNVTNITYNNSVVYNYGPDYGTLSAYSTRPIQRLKLERQTLDPTQAVKAGSLTKVQGDKLLLAAPMKLQKAQGAQLAPQKVKAKIEQPKIEKGWANISDPNQKAQLEQKLKAENPKDIAKPSFQPKTGANVAAEAGAPAGTAEAGSGVAASPGVGKEKGKKGKGQKFQAEQPAATVAPGTSPAASLAPFEQGKGKGRKGKAEREQAMPPAPTATMSPMTGAETQTGATEAEEATGQGKPKKDKATKREERMSAPEQGQGAGEGKRGRKLERSPEPGASNAMPPQAEGGRGKGRQMQGPGENIGKGRGPSEQGEPQGGQGQGKGKGKKDKGEGSPTPTPQ